MVKVIIIEGACVEEDTWDEFSEEKCREWVSMPETWEAVEESHFNYAVIQLIEECEGDCITFIAHKSEIIDNE